METKTLPPYEEAAEVVTGLSGWACKVCRRYWAEDEHMARWCCAGTLPCKSDGCANRVKKNAYVYCEPCLEKRRLERWLALPEVPWDGKTPLAVDDDDLYFFSEDDLREYLEENGLKPEDLRLVLCEEEPKPRFDMSDLVGDYLPEGLDMEGDPSRLEAHVNAWIEKNVPQVWNHGKARPTSASLRAAAGTAAG